MAFITYIVRCADDSLYTGWTDNIEARIRKHNEGKGAKYTRVRLPVLLEVCWEFETRSAAMRAEWHLKRLNRTEKLALIRGDRFLAELLPEIEKTSRQ